MKPLPLTVFSVLSFGIGWWIDSRAASVAKNYGRMHPAAPIHRGSRPAPAPAASSAPARPALVGEAVSPARSLDDLLKIMGKEPGRRAFAKLEKAIAGRSAAELAGLAAGLKARAESD